MGKTFHTPFDFSDAIPAGRRRFWKQILPETSIKYNGRRIDFNRGFHTDLSESFSKKAFDQVPIVFAGAANDHNMDPRNFGGEVIRTEYRGSGKSGGTWGLIEADAEAAAAIAKNPKLGVSARIRQGIEKADGRTFPRAIEHVLLTMNPRVTGMSPWQAVDLSEEDADPEVVDLTAYTYKKGTLMGKTATKTRRSRASQIDLSLLDDDEFQRLIDLAATATVDEDVDEDEDEDLDEIDDEAEVEVKPRRKRSKVKVTKTTEKDEEVDDEDAEDDEVDDVDADLSDRVIKRSEVSQFGQMRLDLAKRDWKQTRANYTAAGVPPFMLDLAEPVLSSPDNFEIDLSDSDEGYDVRDAMTQMLDGVKGIIDLTGELGISLDLSVDEEKDSEAIAFVDAWEKQYS